LNFKFEVESRFKYKGYKNHFAASVLLKTRQAQASASHQLCVLFGYDNMSRHQLPDNRAAQNTLLCQL
jgi:hypothetical protein